MIQLFTTSLAAIAASGAMAAAPSGHGVETVRIGDLDLARPGDVVRLNRRLEEAAMAACGAYDGSVRTLKIAVRRSECFRETLAEAKVSAPVRAMAVR